MNFKKDKPCPSCEVGKMNFASFKSFQNHTVSEPLYLLHMDLFGPGNVQTTTGRRYTLVIVDEYSRFCWCIFLRSKSEAASEIISFIKKVELKYAKRVVQIRSDNGTEFKNHVLDSFCDEKGISRNYSSPRTPEQNGVVERKNRTLIEAARTMLNGSPLPTKYWPEAIGTACHVQNRSIYVKRHKKTAYEVLRCKTPD